MKKNNEPPLVCGTNFSATATEAINIAVGDRSGYTSTFHQRGIFPEAYQTNAKTLRQAARVLHKEFNTLLSDRFILQIPEAGLNFVAWLRSEADFARVARVCEEIGIKPSPLSFYCIEAKLKPAFVFGFAAWTPVQIRESLLRFASALR
jgi:GntR family transcriptional regulator / MocR family aminotransferase